MNTQHFNRRPIFGGVIQNKKISLKRKEASATKQKSPKKSESANEKKHTKSPRTLRTIGRAKKIDRVNTPPAPKKRVRRTSEQVVESIIEKNMQKKNEYLIKSHQLVELIDYPITRGQYKRHYKMDLFGDPKRHSEILKDYYDSEILFRNNDYKIFLDKVLRKKSKSVYHKYRNKVPLMLLDKYIDVLGDLYIEKYRYSVLKLNREFWTKFNSSKSARAKEKYLLLYTKKRQALALKFANIPDF